MSGMLKAEDTIASVLQDIVDYIVDGAYCLTRGLLLLSTAHK